MLADSDGSIIGMRGRRVLRYAPPYTAAELLAALPCTAERLAGRTSLLRRLLRLEPYRTVRTPAGTLLVTSREGVLRLGPGERRLKVVSSDFQGRRPISLCVDGAGRAYFGEYFSNPDRTEVRVLVSEDDGLTWSVCHVFRAGAVRHVHGLIYDVFRDKIWVMTGDYGDEAQIALATPGFGHVDVVVGGDQQARACDGVCRAEGLVYATDTPLEQNHIYRLDPDSGRRETLAEVQQSVLFMGQWAGGMLASTVVEPSQVHATRRVHLWHRPESGGQPGNDWSELMSLGRDAWPLRYFGYPTCSFPAAAADCPVGVLNLRGVRGLDGGCLVFHYGDFRDGVFPDGVFNDGVFPDGGQTGEPLEAVVC